MQTARSYIDLKWISSVVIDSDSELFLDDYAFKERVIVAANELPQFLSAPRML